MAKLHITWDDYDQIAHLSELNQLDTPTRDRLLRLRSRMYERLMVESGDPDYANKLAQFEREKPTGHQSALVTSGYHPQLHSVKRVARVLAVADMQALAAA